MCNRDRDGVSFARRISVGHPGQADASRGVVDWVVPVWHWRHVISANPPVRAGTGPDTDAMSVRVPAPGGASSEPYGIPATADGAIWHSESGVQPNTLVRFDLASQQFQTWKIPNGGGVVRHMVTAPNGDLLLAYSGVNKVGRVRIRKTT